MSSIEQIVARHALTPTSGDQLYRKSDLAWGVRASAGDNGQSGIVAPSCRGWSGTAFNLTANRAYVARFVLQRDLTVTKIAFALTTAAGGDDACDAGLYDSSLAKIVSAGVTTGKLNPSPGVQTVTIASTVLIAGTVYYAAFSCGTLTGSPAVLMTSFGSTSGVQLFGTSAGITEVDFKASSHPLPTNLTVTGGIQNVPVMAVRT